MSDALAEMEAVPTADNTVQDGERGVVLRRVYTDHWTELCRYVLGRFGVGPPEPEDVAQAAFTKFATLDAPQRIRNPRGYLFATARNIVADHHRTAKRREAYTQELTARAAEESVSEISPERVLLDKERLEIFKQALKTMPVKRRRIFLLCRVEGLSCAEVAQRFGISVGAVHKQIARAVEDCAWAFDASDKGRVR